VGSGATGVDDALGNAFVVKVRDLFPQVVILEQDGAARTGLQGVVSIAKAKPLRGGQVLAGLGA
jgi:hypothetical protein